MLKKMLPCPWPPSASRAIFPCRPIRARAYPYKYPRRWRRSRNISPQSSPRKGTHAPSRPAAYKKPIACCRWLARSSLLLEPAAVVVSDSGRPSHADHAADAAPTRSNAVGTPEMSSLGGGQQQQGEARTRLRWTRQLHDRFVLAVAQLGGADSKSSLLACSGSLIR